MKKIRHLLKKKSGFYFNPTKLMKKAGFRTEPLGKDLALAEIRAEEINAEWDEIKKSIDVLEPERGDIDWLIAEFQRDPTWYGDLAKVTRYEVDAAFKELSEKIGPAKVRAIKVAHCRALYNDIRLNSSTHKANKIYKWFNRALNYAIERGLIEYNVATGLKRKSTTGRDQIYTPDEINSIIDKCLNPGVDVQGTPIPRRKSIALATAISYDTSLPRQDILNLRWSQFDGQGFTVKQIKNRGQLTLYLMLRLETIQMLTDSNVVPLNKDQHIILNEMTGKPWDEKLFSKAFLKFTRRSGLTGRTFHDIRGTALSEMGNTGSTNAEIVSYSGHNIASKVISDYVRPDKQAALRAFKKRFPNENI